MRLSTCVPGPFLTDHSLSRSSAPLTHTYLEKVAAQVWRQSVRVSLISGFSTQLLFFCVLPGFSSKACRCVAMRKKTGSRPPALVSMERHARKTKNSELYKHHSRRSAARTTHGGGKWATRNKESFLDHSATTQRAQHAWMDKESETDVLHKQLINGDVATS